MLLRQSILYGLITIVLFCCGDIQIFNRTSSVYVGDTILYYVKFNASEIPTECVVSYNTNNVTKTTWINLSDENVHHDANDTTGARIEGLGRMICGFKLNRVEISDPTVYQLNVTYRDDGGTVRTDSSQLKVEAIKDGLIGDVNTTMTELGAIFPMDCTPLPLITEKEQVLHVMLFNPQNELVKEDVKEFEHVIEFVTMDDLGVWTCTVGMTNTMRALHRYHNVTLIELEVDNVDKWYKEQDGYGTVGCRINYASSNSKGINTKYCQIFTPLHEIVTITANHRATPRYTSLGTNFDKSICQIEFPLPIRAEEVGEWQCHIDNAGGRIYVNAKQETTRIVEHHLAYSEVGTPNEYIKCEVEHPVDECVIIRPDGTHLPYGGDATHFYRGHCYSPPFKVEASDLGVWTCLISRPDAFHDTIITYELLDYKTLKATPKTVENDNDQLKLMCRANTPLRACYFISPTARIYHVSETKRSSSVDDDDDDDVRYMGRGLNYGDCGLRLTAVRPEDEGTWRCIGLQGSFERNAEISDTIHVKVFQHQVFTAAVSIGVPVGLAVCLLTSVAFAYYYNRRKSTQRRPSDASEIIFVAGHASLGDARSSLVRPVRHYETTT